MSYVEQWASWTGVVWLTYDAMLVFAFALMVAALRRLREQGKDRAKISRLEGLLLEADGTVFGGKVKVAEAQAREGVAVAAGVKAAGLLAAAELLAREHSQRADALEEAARLAKHHDRCQWQDCHALAVLCMEHTKNNGRCTTGGNGGPRCSNDSKLCQNCADHQAQTARDRAIKAERDKHGDSQPLPARVAKTLGQQVAGRTALITATYTSAGGGSWREIEALIDLVPEIKSFGVQSPLAYYQVTAASWVDLQGRQHNRGDVFRTNDPELWRRFPNAFRRVRVEADTQPLDPLSTYKDLQPPLSNPPLGWYR